MRAYTLTHGTALPPLRENQRGTTQMSFGKVTSVVDRLAVALVYTAVVLVMPLAAYSFVAQSL